MKNRRNIILICVLLILPLILIAYYYNLAERNKLPDDSIDLNGGNYIIDFNKIKNILDHHFKDRNFQSKEIFLFVNMKNFECHYCYEQFLKIVDILNSRYKKNAQSVLLLFPEDKEESSFQKIKLKKWLKTTNLSYEYLILPNDPEKLDLKRSRIMLTKNEIIEFTIPMSASDLDKFEILLQQ